MPVGGGGARTGLPARACDAAVDGGSALPTEASWWSYGIIHAKILIFWEKTARSGRVQIFLRFRPLSARPSPRVPPALSVGSARRSARSCRHLRPCPPCPPDALSPHASAPSAALRPSYAALPRRPHEGLLEALRRPSCVVAKAFVMENDCVRFGFRTQSFALSSAVVFFFGCGRCRRRARAWGAGGGWAGLRTCGGGS